MSQVATDTEDAIIDLFHRHDERAMDRLYATYGRYLTGVCTRYMGADDRVKDVMQESLIKIFTRIADFDYRGRGSLRAWMSRIVANESISELRRQQRLGACLLDTDPPDVADLPDDDPDTRGLDAQTMMRLLGRLPDGYRTVVNLYVIEGHSHQEIARMLGIKADSSASQLHRAKRMLARIINDYKNERL